MIFKSLILEPKIQGGLCKIRAVEGNKIAGEEPR